MRRFMMRSGYTSAAVALFARMTVQPTAARKRLINRTIKKFIADGVWDKLDAIYLTAAHTSQAGRLNWKGATFELTPVNTPTFTTDRGYSGDGVDDCLTTGFTPFSSGTMTADDHHMGVWMQGSTPPLTCCPLGNDRLSVWPNVSDTVRMTSASPSFNDSARGGGTAPGHVSLSRTGSAGYKQFKDGAPLATITQGTSGGSVYPIRMLCYTDTIGNLQYFETRTVAAAHWGRGLSDAEMAATKVTLGNYMTGVGA